MSVVYRFRSIRMITRPIATIAITAAAPMLSTYASVIGAGDAVGGAVGGVASSTPMAVSACEP